MGGGLVRLKTIFAMLDDCARGHERRESDHYWRIAWEGKYYATLPTGGHGERNPEIQPGHVRKMTRALDIDKDCASRHIPRLFQ